MRSKATRFLQSKQAAVLSGSLLLLILTVFLVQTYGKAYRENGYDFTSYLASSRALFNGISPYETGSPYPFIYPLFLCVVLFPLTLVPYWLSNLIWFLANISALYLSAEILFRLSSASLPHKITASLLLIPFLLLTNVIQNNLLNGQVNFIVLLLCVLFLKYHLRSNTLLATVFLAAAISIKLTPLVLVVYLVARRDLLSSAMALGMSALFVIGAPYAFAGPATFTWYSYYVHSFLVNKVATTGTGGEGPSFSITSVIGFLIPSLSVIMSVAAASISSLVPVVTTQVRLLGTGREDNQPLVFSLYMIAPLLISPMSETHHLINLFPGLCVVMAAMLLSSERYWFVGIRALTVVLVFLVAGRFYFLFNLAGIVALYLTVLWICYQPVELPQQRTFESRA